MTRAAEAWVGAICGASLVGLVGVLPLFLVSVQSASADGGESPTLRTMLGFAAGGLLGNAVLNLLPEAFEQVARVQPADGLRLFGLFDVTPGHHGLNGDVYVGIWVVLGVMVMLVLEKAVTARSAEAPTPQPRGKGKGKGKGKGRAEAKPKRSPAGYLNLLVNTLDNFTHGLAVAGSFLHSREAGIATTLAIVTHEIPHELSDYAILLRAGFEKNEAIAAQFLTSAGGICGACFGLYCADAGISALWILPFTAGGFLYIALVSLLPGMFEKECAAHAWWRDPAHVVGGMLLVKLGTHTHGAVH